MDGSERITQRLRIALVLMELARWKESEEQQRHALTEATALADVELVALVSNNLATLLMDTNRLGEADRLMRRALEILGAVGQQTGHEHPQFQSVKANYQALQRAVGPDRSD